MEHAVASAYESIAQVHPEAALGRPSPHDPSNRKEQGRYPRFPSTPFPHHPLSVLPSHSTNTTLVMSLAIPHQAPDLAETRSTAPSCSNTSSTCSNSPADGASSTTSLAGLRPLGRRMGGWEIMCLTRKVSLIGMPLLTGRCHSRTTALDQIITQIMENSSAHPVPASEEVLEKLPREVLEEGCKYTAHPSRVYACVILILVGCARVLSPTTRERLRSMQRPILTDH